ncbi:hypothetical protein BYT27DRAFT_7196501 [Phlegmacium glaucopus]|nr:hypothetical protein BYT27DRAFT_7196501 [Phlegmacium glaucopus]
MSDQQPSPPPKPKPGSLRDRIAAFEKSASTTAPASTGQPAPAPRPKPAGFASWKPKVPSPPSSPSSNSIDNAASSSLSKATGTMSASDAKESITKGGGGSLKDRMAALQGRGAFGAPAPPLAPKPAVEKPRWKPPPAVAAPADNDDQDSNTTGDEPPAAAVERTKSPPVSVKSSGSLDLPKPIAEESSVAEPTTSTEGDADGTTDPEEEERQRRAAIAARMARLGGARMGMTPPVLAKKPPVPVRKPTREDVPKQEDREEVPKRDSLSFEERGKSIEGNIASSPVASPPNLTDSPHIQAQSDVELASEYLPVRKNSENASLLSVDSTETNTARSPPSMPVPTVPRRAGPPRKKPVKPTAPPPEVPEVPEERVEEVIAAPAIISTVDEVEQKAAIELPEHEGLLGQKEIDIHQGEIHDEPQSIYSNVQHEFVEELVAESEPAGSGESKEQEFAYKLQPATVVSSDELKQEHKHEHVHIDYPDQLEAVVTEDQSDDDGSHYEYEDEHSQGYDEKYAAEHHEHQRLQQHDGHHVKADAGPQPSSAVGVASTQDEDEDEDAVEEARRKRVAERLAKMGGVNPFAAPLPLRRSSEETGHGSSPVITSYASPPAVPTSPHRPDIPTRRASLRSSHEVADPLPLPVVESKVEEEQGEAEYSDEVEGEDNDVYDEEGSSYDLRAHEKSMEESSLSAYEPPLPRHHLHQQADAAPAHQLHDPVLRPPIPSGPRSFVQVQQYGRHDEEEEHTAYPTTRHLSPPSRLPDPPVSHEAPSPPARPAQPPRRIVPQAPEEQEEEEEEEAGTDDEGHEGLAPPHLFAVQPRGPVLQHPVRGGQRYKADEDEDGSENDAPALPVLQRRSSEASSSIPPPTRPPAALPSHVRLHHHHLSAPPSDISEPDSDHDGQALPVRPRHTAVTPAAPTPVQGPPATPRRSVPSVPANEESLSSYGMPSVAVSEPEPDTEEVLDEEEGDPIDPAFHSPSRRGSMVNMHGSASDDTPGLPVQVPSPTMPARPEERDEAQQQQEQDQVKRQTIAERMAKLGGIKFGAAPIPTAISRPPPAPRVPQEEELDEEGGSHHHPEHYPQADVEDVEGPVEVSEEEEERARKERIAAKLAGMGGMRIGMMPMGVGSLPPQRAHSLRDDNVPPLSPTRAVPPPVRPPPPPTRPQIHDTDSERASDDGVKVEAEESEMEEVDFEDVAEEFEETTPPPPPPVPSRGGRVAYRRESSEKAVSSPPPPPPPIPASRPPVPVALPARRSSVQASKSTGSVEFGFSPTRSSFLPAHPQSEYVMVDEPRSLEEASPPSRRNSRFPPARSTPNPMGIPQTSDPNSISSQWELPSIPTASLDFGNSADLSLSWTDAGEPISPTSQPPPPPTKQPAVLPPKPKAMLPSELQLSTDELMMIWGRVGVQVCEVATTLFEKSKKSLIGDGTYAGFIAAVLAGVPNAAPISIASGEYGYLVYAQNGSSVQKRVSEIMPGDIVEIHEGKLKGHKGIQIYHQNVGGSGEDLLGIVGEFEAKKSKVRVFHANQHVGQQTVESVSYRLEDLKSGTVKVYRILELEQ